MRMAFRVYRRNAFIFVTVITLCIGMHNYIFRDGMVGPSDNNKYDVLIGDAGSRRVKFDNMEEIDMDDIDLARIIGKKWERRAKNVDMGDVVSGQQNRRVHILIKDIILPTTTLVHKPATQAYVWRVDDMGVIRKQKI